MTKAGEGAGSHPPGSVIDVEALARTIEGCPSVARLTPGPGVEVATYLRGRRVRGVRFDRGQLEVHVAARYGRSMPEVAREVRNALAGLLGGAPVAVFIDDIETDGPLIDDRPLSA